MSPNAPDAPDAPEERREPRQRVERVRGARRAKLTPAVGTDPDPELPRAGEASAAQPEATGPNDERMRRDVPPHY